MLEIAKKELVSPIDPLSNVLDRLGSQFIPEDILGPFLQFGDMLLELVELERFSVQPIVAPVQPNTVVIDIAGNIDRLVQALISLRLIEFKTVRLHTNILPKNAG